jgi:hypothetical protein
VPEEGETGAHGHRILRELNAWELDKIFLLEAFRHTA